MVPKCLWITILKGVIKTSTKEWPRGWVGRKIPKFLCCHLSIPLFRFLFQHIHDKTRILSTVGHSEGAPTDLKGKYPFAPFSGFTPGTLVFTHYTSARWRGIPPMELWWRISANSIEGVTKMDIFKKWLLSCPW